MNIALIGSGNLGTALAEGLLRNNFVTSDQLLVTRKHGNRPSPLQELNVHVGTDNIAAVKQADIVILALKPHNIKPVILEIKNHIPPTAALVSLATGISLAELSAWSGRTQNIFVAMPNTAMAIGESMTCISALNAEAKRHSHVEQIFRTMGEVLSIDAELMDAATVLGACGIAYAMRFIRAASQGGIEIGFGAKQAQKIAAQTVKGAASLLLKKESHPEEEIDKVTTPQGCTIAGLNEMEHQGFSSALIKGIATSFKKIDAIAKKETTNH